VHPTDSTKMNRFITNTYDYMNGIGASGGSASSGNNRESNSSLYYASAQNGNENGGYPIHENFMFYHDQRTGVATTPTACVGGDYSGGMTAPGYMIQQPAASQYLASFQRRHLPNNMYAEAPPPVGSHCLGTSQTILAAAREMCGSPFDEDSYTFDQDPETPQNNYYQEESSTVHTPRLIPTTTTISTCILSLVKCASAREITTEELL